MSQSPSSGYVVITPVRDEAAYIEHCIASMLAQTEPPIEWVIVDDGSSDSTPEILAMHAARTNFVHVVRRENRGYRAAGTGVIEAFSAGFSALKSKNWEFIVKLDGDLSFPPDYFARCLSKFRLDSRLGIGGGLLFVQREGKWRVDVPHDPPFHVRGATKIYRRRCWDDVSPLVASPGGTH